ncbi:hypothetical protein WBP06_22685 [Novosphingobium sp. BL-8H]|uniref:hypothetical protein n=1 Tax=Novosphingobium sp. BL-8H TaxID=3127640 RepID=UPI0037580C9B
MNSIASVRFDLVKVGTVRRDYQHTLRQMGRQGLRDACLYRSDAAIVQEFLEPRACRHLRLQRSRKTIAAIVHQ